MRAVMKRRFYFRMLIVLLALVELEQVVLMLKRLDSFLGLVLR